MLNKVIYQNRPSTCKQNLSITLVNSIVVSITTFTEMALGTCAMKKKQNINKQEGLSTFKIIYNVTDNLLIIGFKTSTGICHNDHATVLNIPPTPRNSKFPTENQSILNSHPRLQKRRYPEGRERKRPLSTCNGTNEMMTTIGIHL